MTYKTFMSAAASYGTLQSHVSTIYSCVIYAEQKYLETLPVNQQDQFKKDAVEVYKFDTERRWGSSWFESYLEDIEVEVEGVTAKFQKEDYCRSCYMGMIHDELFVPEWLIDAYDQEEDYDGSVFEESLKRFIKERVDKIHQYRQALKAKAEIDAKKRQMAAESKKIMKEAQERVEFERLKIKFGENQ
jgi:hypothetical protein